MALAAVLGLAYLTFGVREAVVHVLGSVVLAVR
jgi:hypothetical protein